MEYSVQQILELACAAQRMNGNYLKDNVPVLTDDFKVVGYKFSNKTLMLWAANPTERVWNGGGDPPNFTVIEVSDEDKLMTEEIRSYYRRLMFSIMSDPENSFQQEVFSLLNKETMPGNKFGFIACLPSTYKRDRLRNTIGKQLKNCDSEYLAEKGSTITNKVATIVDCQRSKNFDAWNITAIIDNKVVSWFSKTAMNQEHVGIRQAKVKEHQRHWISDKNETRLNYVKVLL